MSKSYLKTLRLIFDHIRSLEATLASSQDISPQDIIYTSKLIKKNLLSLARKVDRNSLSYEKIYISNTIAMLSTRNNNIAKKTRRDITLRNLRSSLVTETPSNSDETNVAETLQTEIQKYLDNVEHQMQ